jgi:hypothetical protein
VPVTVWLVVNRFGWSRNCLRAWILQNRER